MFAQEDHPIVALIFVSSTVLKDPAGFQMEAMIPWKEHQAVKQQTLVMFPILPLGQVICLFKPWFLHLQDGAHKTASKKRNISL